MSRLRRFLNEPYPLAGAPVEEVAARVARALSRRGDVAAAFLFGSQASGEAVRLQGLPGLRVVLAHEYRHLDRDRPWADLAAGINALHQFMDHFRRTE